MTVVVFRPLPTSDPQAPPMVSVATVVAAGRTDRRKKTTDYLTTEITKIFNPICEWCWTAALNADWLDVTKVDPGGGAG